MKKISVQIKDKYTLELLEDGVKGDLIDLKEITSFDTSTLEDAISKGRDSLYVEKLKAERQNITNELKLEYEKKLAELNHLLEEKEKDEKHALEIQASQHQLSYQKLQQDYQEKTKKLENDLANILSQQSTKEKNLSLEMEQKHANEVSGLKDMIRKLEEQARYQEFQMKNLQELSELKKNQELEKMKSTFELEKMELIRKNQEELSKRDNEIQRLIRQKSVLNVKQTGEDLESWCDHTVKEQMQNGFFNCVWYKDNEVIKSEGEQKGSKADYIFKIYASEAHQESELLASICLDMKDENPDSINKQTNEHYYKALDANRMKKHCKYAVLVSNLETDKPNDIPIYRVRDYDEMYVVRPAYLMTFLNMITSLSTRFSELVLNKSKEELEVKDKIALLQEFEELKKTYLDKPLEGLEKDIMELSKQNASIHQASSKMEETILHIQKQYLNGIKDKLSKFERKLH